MRRRAKFDLLSVKTALEVLYAQGYTELPLPDFIRVFSEKYDLSEDDEGRVHGMLRVLERNNVIKVVDGRIRMWNLLSSNLRLIINK
jgi:hypothetical protein